MKNFVYDVLKLQNGIYLHEKFTMLVRSCERAEEDN